MKAKQNLFRLKDTVWFLYATYRTKFDLDVQPVDSDTHLRIRQMSLDLSSPNHIPLNVRIAEFCEDPQNMDEMTAFIDDILKKAQIEADARLEQPNKVFSSMHLFRWACGLIENFHSTFRLT